MTLGQRWLWDCYESDILSVMELADGDPVDVIHLGDIAQGLRFMDGVSQTRFADQLAIATANGAPWWIWPNINSVTLISGTSVHEGGEGSAGDLVAQLWGAGFAAHELVTIDGIDFDIAHHGPHPGIREWTSGNQARYYLRNCLMVDDPPARVYLRAHRHQYLRETLYVPQTADIIIAPAYQLPSAYVRERMQSPSAAICGMVALEVEDGRLCEVVPLVHKIDLRKRVTL